MDKGQFLSCAFMWIFFGSSSVNTAFVTITSSRATLGNNPHDVTCDYKTYNNEIFKSVKMYEIVNGSEKQLAALHAGETNPEWHLSASNDIKRRAVLMQPRGFTSLQIHFKNTLCGDEKTYICLLRFLTSRQQGKVQQHSEAINVIVTGSHLGKATYVSITPSAATLGNNPHHIKCNYNLGAGDRFRSLSLFQIVGGKDILLSVCDSDMEKPVWDSSVSSDIKRRAIVMQPDGSGSLQISFHNTVCSDRKMYKCHLTYRHGEELQEHHRIQTAQVIVKDDQCVSTTFVTITSSVGVLGKSPHYVQCDSHVIAGERLDHLDIIEIVNGTKRVIAAVYADGSVWDEKSMPKFKNRPFLIKNIGPNSLQVYYIDTVCSDAKLYQCQLIFRTRKGESAKLHSETIQVIIEG